MLRDIVRDILDAADDLRVVGEVPEGADLGSEGEQLGDRADVLVVGGDGPTAQVVWEALAEDPEGGAVVIVGDGRLVMLSLGELRSDTLTNAVRRAAAGAVDRP